MNFNNKIEKFEKREGEMEKEKFEPQIIFDFIRHGEAIYGPELKRRVEELGYEWEKLLPTSMVLEKEMGEQEDLEGEITPEGESQLREAIEGLTKRIDKDNENLMVLFGPRFRTIESSSIILDELGKQNIDVRKAREHRDLIDMKKHWIAILEFVKKKAPDVDRPIQYWLNMSENELHEADLEGFGDTDKRMDHFTRLIERYARAYKDQLGLEKKKLRVIAVTHDVNVLSILKKEGISLEKAGLIKNAQIVELGVDKEGKAKLLNSP